MEGKQTKSGSKRTLALKVGMSPERGAHMAEAPKTPDDAR